jgi:hypothetical protein
MSCERFAEAITDHACGAPLADDVRRHVDVCEACGRALEAQQQAIAAAEADLCRALDVRVSSGFAANVMRRARAESERARVARVWWIGAGAAAAAALALGIWLAPPRVAPGVPHADRVSGASPTAAPTLPPSNPAESASVTAEELPRQPSAATDPARVAGPRRRTTASAPASFASARTALPATARTREPEVIVPDTQARAIARLNELLAARVLDGAVLPPAEPLGGTPPPLVIRPLTVPEIVIADVGMTNDSGRAGRAARQ